MKSITLGESENRCRHCRGKLFWKAHAEITKKELARPYYFSKWEYCPGCKAVWHHDELKVVNRNAAARRLQERQEYGEQLSFLRDIR